jgi:hypothetical protein
MVLDTNSKYERDCKELFMKSLMWLDDRVNLIIYGKELFTNLLMLLQFMNDKLLRDGILLFEKLFRDGDNCREVMLYNILLSNASRFFKSYRFSVLIIGIVLFLIYCTFNLLKFNKLRLLNTFDSNIDIGELPKSKDLMLDNSLRLKSLRLRLSPTINKFVLRLRSSSPGKTLSVKFVTL